MVNPDRLFPLKREQNDRTDRRFAKHSAILPHLQEAKVAGKKHQDEVLALSRLIKPDTSTSPVALQSILRDSQHFGYFFPPGGRLKIVAPLLEQLAN